jgi:hypothetical protein|tara:strand:+ start:284 stop:436 length:153 start_codon:yes stop_codon:yes gene_type:complete
MKTGIHGGMLLLDISCRSVAGGANRNEVHNPTFAIAPPATLLRKAGKMIH